MSNETVEVNRAELEALMRLVRQKEADLKKLCRTWKGIISMLGIKDGEKQTSVLMKLPGILRQVTANPDMFNFIDDDLQRIINENTEMS
jgi:hypothetical protein